MQEQTLPRSQPLKSFKELLAWQPGHDEYNVSNTPLHSRPDPIHRGRVHLKHAENSSLASPSIQGPSALEECKVIVCHDMAGGYAEDAATQGNDYSTIYSAQYWNHVDTFIYFSHYRITIPPPVWINAAHRNGVRCLGNIITETDRDLLETDEMVSGPGQALQDENGKDIVNRQWFSRTYADKLVDMAVYYKFDGWFINIESDLRGGGEQAKQTIAFLDYLRSQIHARIPGGELIWYDSVISSTGEVDWQDKLTLENYKFFEKCDGIFTNYTWKEPYVADSMKLAGCRNRDVYTGIDVWGRNTFGGGKFTAYKALDVIQRERSSCAIFAPAWTYESYLGKEGFMTHDRFFWTGYRGAGIQAESLPLSSFRKETGRLLSGELNVDPNDKGKNGGPVDNKDFRPVAAYIPPRPSGTSSWFYSNFDRGFGKSFWVSGKRVSDKPWSHLSQQSLPPQMAKDIYALGQGYSIQTSTTLRWIVSPEDAYHGGTSVVIREFYESEPEPSLGHPTDSATRNSPVANVGHSKKRSILVPLFDTQISMISALTSSIELIYKPYQDTAQVGIHFGLLIKGIGKDKHLSRTARKVLQEEWWQSLNPELKKHGCIVDNIRSSPCASANKDLICLVTLDNPDPTAPPEAALAFGLQQEHHQYTIEALADGWQRLVLNLSGLLAPLATHSDAFTIVLSQLGVTLSYREQSALNLGQEEESRSLAVLGSLAVVPTWSLGYKGSCVQGVLSENTEAILLKQPTQDNVLHVQETQATLQQSQQQELHPTPISISSTITWNVGFPTTKSLDQTSPSNAYENHISTSEYSHFCVYVSLERAASSKNATKGSNDVESEGVKVFVGTAFTNRYRIANFNVGLEHKRLSTIVPEPSNAAVTKEVLSLETLQQQGLEVWVWVQGIRRDGRADEKQDWGKSKLL
ncbi:glycosyl hydrolase family 85-domain-containing protein [Mortierella sp. GBAus27b]|nr:hypothetical protein BGX31_004442 [Mortierella sp. GBA43]KAI8358318.1 glycosyl hydrolase family 85-domain-containing protein [Mortierella sp. GBAus27b]